MSSTKDFIKQKFPDGLGNTNIIEGLMESFLKEGLTKAAEQKGISFVHKAAILNVFKEMTGKEMPK